MECKVTCFDRVMNLVMPLPKDKHKEAVEIIQEWSFQDFLDFCIENGCFTEMQSYTLYDGIVMWEDLDGNYWEEDYDKLHELYDKVGITEDMLYEQYGYLMDEEHGKDAELLIDIMKCNGIDLEDLLMEQKEQM